MLILAYSTFIFFLGFYFGSVPHSEERAGGRGLRRWRAFFWYWPALLLVLGVDNTLKACGFLCLLRADASFNMLVSSVNQAQEA